MNDAPVMIDALDHPAATETAMRILHANQTAARYTLTEYRTSLAPQTIRRQMVDLHCFRTYLAEVGITPPGDLATAPAA